MKKLAVIAATVVALLGLVGVTSASAHPSAPVAMPCCKFFN